MYSIYINGTVNSYINIGNFGASPFHTLSDQYYVAINYAVGMNELSSDVPMFVITVASMYACDLTY